jgi:hypothetical protein
LEVVIEGPEGEQVTYVRVGYLDGPHPITLYASTTCPRGNLASAMTNRTYSGTFALIDAAGNRSNEVGPKTFQFGCSAAPHAFASRSPRGILAVALLWLLLITRGSLGRCRAKRAAG